MNDVRSLAYDVVKLGAAERHVSVARLSDADLKSLGREGRRDLLATLVVSGETAHQLGRFPKVLQTDIDAGRRQAAAAALVRGEMEVGIAIAADGGLDRLCQAARSADWETVRKIYEASPPLLRESAEALLLYAGATATTAGLAEARPLLDRVILALFMAGDFLSPCFWGVFNLLPADDMLRAWVICAVALGLVRRLGAGAFPLVEPMIEGVAATIASLRVSPEPLWPVLQALMQRREDLNARQLRVIAERMADLAERASDRERAVHARDIAAQAAFACGHTDRALSHQKRRAEHLGVDRERQRTSIWSARRIDVDRPGSDANARMERQDADAWVTALAEAQVVSGRHSSGTFHYVLTQDGGVLMHGLGADPALHIGVDGSPFRARSPLGDVLVDLSERPQPWRMLEPAVLIGGSEDDDNWLLHYFPKLDVWRRANIGRTSDVAFFIDHRPSRRQKEVLGGLRLRDGDLIQSDPYYDRVFEKLYVPSAPSLMRAVAVLRETFLTVEASGTDLVYIHCALAEAAMSEQAELAPALMDRGAKLLVPDQRAMADVAHTVAAASVVVRWAGRGEAYLAFCSPGALVIEIIDPQRDDGSRSGAILSCVGAKLQRFAAFSDGVANGPARVDMKALLRCVDERRSDLGEGRH